MVSVEFDVHPRIDFWFILFRVLMPRLPPLPQLLFVRPAATCMGVCVGVKRRFGTASIIIAALKRLGLRCSAGGQVGKSSAAKMRARTHMFLHFCSILVINTGSEGPYLVTFLEVPEIIQQVLQSIRNH